MLLPTCKHMHAELSPALKQLEQLTTLVQQEVLPQLQQQGQLLQQQGERLLSEYCETRSLVFRQRPAGVTAIIYA